MIVIPHLIAGDDRWFRSSNQVPTEHHASGVRSGDLGCRRRDLFGPGSDVDGVIITLPSPDPSGIEEGLHPGEPVKYEMEIGVRLRVDQNLTRYKETSRDAADVPYENPAYVGRREWS
jgi:hypothetical protein